MSKSAQKNRRKKQQQQRSKQQQQQDMGGRSQEQRDAVSIATHLMGEGVSSEGGAGDSGDREKRIKNLKKVLYNIIVRIHSCVLW